MRSQEQKLYKNIMNNSNYLTRVSSLHMECDLKKKSLKLGQAKCTTDSQKDGRLTWKTPTLD